MVGGWSQRKSGELLYRFLEDVGSEAVDQTEAELGQRLSGGCQRQANADAAFVWDFADIGTTVVVI